MIKVVSKFFAYLASILIFIVAIIFAINFVDEPIKPEVLQVLAWKPPVGVLSDNGYLMLLGMDAPEGDDAYELGKQRLQADFSRFSTSQKNHKEPLAEGSLNEKTLNNIDWKESRCDYVKQKSCVDFYLEQGATKFSQITESQRILLERYKDLRLSEVYIESTPPILTGVIPRYSLLTSASELERAQAILEISQGHLEQGVSRYCENSLFSRRLLAESNSLISHMIAVSMVQRDMRILSELLLKYPVIAKRYSEQLMPILQSINTSEFSMKKVMTVEGSTILPTMYNLKYETSNMIGENGGFFQDLGSFLSLKLFYQPNATVNLFYDWGQLLVNLSEADAHQLDKISVDQREKKKALLGSGIGFFYFKNTVGKILVSVAGPDYVSYIERHHDTEGYLRLVNIQLRLINGEEKTGVFTKYLNPYTLLPIEFDEKDNLLTFHGRQASNQNFNKSSIYQVKL